VARDLPAMAGAELASEASIPCEEFHAAVGPCIARVCLIHLGAKKSIVEQLTQRGCEVTVLPQGSSAEEILRRAPDGLFLSNGPGDPAACRGPIETVRALLGKLPIYGICLGHQILALAAGARTEKLSFGHHGANHPVEDLRGGTVAITSQNHGFAIVEDSLFGTGFEVTHRSLYDGTVEGIASHQHRAAAVQFHPEAAPGPHDARPLFDDFLRLMGVAGDAA